MEANENKRVYKWLQNKLCTEGTLNNNFSLSEMLRDEKATTFLLIWPIMEQELFNKFLKKANIAGFCKNNSSLYRTMNVEKIAQHFHTRYQCNKKLHNLLHSDKDDEIKQILKKPYEQLSDEEKLYLLLFVTYRYRNNIFHGNKSIKSWSCYKEQINNCINFMMKLIDEYNKSNNNVGGN